MECHVIAWAYMSLYRTRLSLNCFGYAKTMVDPIFFTLDMILCPLDVAPGTSAPLCHPPSYATDPDL